MLRLRAGFGVGAKADLMAFLIGASSSLRETAIWTTANVVAEATSYSRASVARAAADMSLAGFIEASADRPPMYSIEVDPWARVLRLWDPYEKPRSLADSWDAASFEVPPWRFWAQLFAFLVSCVDWAREATNDTAAPVVHASRARDLVERFGRYLVWNGIDLPDGRLLPGERYLGAFVELVEQVVERVEVAL